MSFFISRFLFLAVDKSPEDILRERFAEMNIDLEAFSSLRYVGIQTQQPPTDYSAIRNALLLEIENTAVRSPRQPDVIFKAIDVIIFIFQFNYLSLYYSSFNCCSFNLLSIAS